MRRIPTILAAALLTAVGTAACTSDTGGDEPETAPACDADLAAGLSRWADAGFSGSIAIGGGDGPACLASFGLANTEAGEANTEDTVFAIGSVSKAVTAAAVLDLADAGTLEPTDRAGDLLPGLGGPAADATVEQLLLHTSGLAGSHGADHEPLDRADAISALGALDTDFAPGTDYLYSNAGYALLALIVDEQTGSYRDYVAAEILTLPDGDRLGGFWDGEPAPEGPRALGYGPDGEPAQSTGDFAGPHWALAGNGDVAMTAADLAAWTEALFAGDIIAPDAVDALRATVFDHGDGSTELPGWVALDAAAFGTPVVMSAGGGGDTGHEAVVAWLPDTGVTLVVTSNTAAVTAGALVEAVGPALAAGEALPVPEGHAEVDPEALLAKEGVYALGTGGTLTVTAADGFLEVAADGADAATAMFASGDFTAEEAADHDARVLAFLEGDSDAGREELAAAEDAFGPVDDLASAGTVVEESELRTYVRFTGPEGTGLGWYALDDHDGVQGVWLDAEPPVFTLVPTSENEFRQENLSGAGVGLRAVFTADAMTVTGPAGTVEAVRE
ncbi:serine hydrolase domain-containing protein [Glycomyces paridis]|nr:serine hydrolase domain-containing protein [Glycomyces paridis]